jgi:hypothetical protein
VRFWDQTFNEEVECDVGEIHKLIDETFPLMVAKVEEERIKY